MQREHAHFPSMAQRTSPLQTPKRDPEVEPSRIARRSLAGERVKDISGHTSTIDDQRERFSRVASSLPSLRPGKHYPRPEGPSITDAQRKDARRLGFLDRLMSGRKGER